nr:extracellular solute-binding protein [uncultured Blautia sp.]
MRRSPRKTLLFFSAILILTLLAGCSFGTGGTKKTDGDVSSVKDRENWDIAETSPLGKYPELVTYTLGQMKGTNNSNLPEGQTYEDNAYTRYLKKTLNVQNKNIFMESEERYDEALNILVKDRNLPDIFLVSDRETLEELVENDLIEDLTEVYKSCASDKIQEMYESYGEELLASGTFDGKLFALPETAIDDGPQLLWLRRDWMKQLGLKEPKTLEEAFSLIRAFQENRMGAEDGEDPVGLVCDPGLVGTVSTSYSVDSVFEMFGAYPQQWIKNADGEIVYGSLTEETKEALGYLRELYKQGILDPDFALRAQNNIRDLVVNGKCGAFFGLWWTPNNPLMDEYRKNKETDWEPYYLTADAKRTVEVYSTFWDSKYVVVRKGYEHPEIVMKILSVLFDYSRYEAEDADEVNSYFALNVDPTARPLMINVDYNEATYMVTKHIREALYSPGNAKTREDLSAIEASYFDACKEYLEAEVPSVEAWAAYKSRISAVGLLVDANYRASEKKYLGDGDGEIPQTLRLLEKNAFIQIIMGKKPVSSFDSFVEEWYRKGGDSLTERVRKGIMICEK